MVEILRVAKAVKHPLVQNPMLQLLDSTENLQNKITVNLQWAVNRVKETQRMTGVPSIIVRSIVSPKINPDDQIIASAGEDGSIKLWDLQGKLLKSWKADSKRIWNVAFSPDKQLLASSGEDGKVRIWNLEDILKLQEIKLKKMPEHKEIKTYQGKDEVYARYVSFSSDGKKLASIEGQGGKGRIGLWDLKGKQISIRGSR